MAKNDFYIGIYILVIAVALTRSEINPGFIVLWALINIVFFVWREYFKK